MDRKQLAREFIVSNARPHLPSNAKNIRWSVIDETKHINAMGFEFDPKPHEGVLLAIDESWVLLKTGRVEFVAIHRSCFEPSLDLQALIGAKVLATAYARKTFDGTRLDAPKSERRDSENGSNEVQIFTLGNTRTKFPFMDIKTPQLKEMIEQMELLRTPDGRRTVAQVLVDAHAQDLNVNDPGKFADIVSNPPSFSCSVTTNKFVGTLIVQYDRSLDAYDVILRVDGNDVSRKETVFFDELASVIVDLVDDGTWKWVTVDVLKLASKKMLAA